MSKPKDDPDDSGEPTPSPKGGKPTAQFLASEIAEAQGRTANQAEKAADRLDDAYAGSITALKESHQIAISALQENSAKAVAAEEKRGSLYLKGMTVFAGLFALSLITNIVLVSGLLKSDVNVTGDGVTINNGKGATQTTSPTKPKAGKAPVEAPSDGGPASDTPH